MSLAFERRRADDEASELVFEQLLELLLALLVLGLDVGNGVLLPLDALAPGVALLLQVAGVLARRVARLVALEQLFATQLEGMFVCLWRKKEWR